MPASTSGPAGKHFLLFPRSLHFPPSFVLDANTHLNRDHVRHMITFHGFLWCFCDKTLGSAQCDPESPPQPPALKCPILSQSAHRAERKGCGVFAAPHQKPFQPTDGFKMALLSSKADNWVLQLLAFKSHRKLPLNSSCEHA